MSAAIMKLKNFEEVNENLRHTSETAFRLASLNMPAMQMVMYATILVHSLVRRQTDSVMAGSMQVGELTGFLSYVLQVLNSLMMISNVFLLLTRALASSHRIMDVMEEEIDIPDTADSRLSIAQGDVRFSARVL